jgi:putative membrane protein
MQRFATLVFAATSVFLAACSSNPIAPSPLAQGTAPFARAYVIVGELTNADETFIRFAAQAYQAQITLGELAEKRGDTAELKAFARRMQQDNRDSLASLREMAPRDVPTTITLNAQQQGWADSLAAASGSGLDRLYALFMVTEFNNNIAQFPIQSDGKNVGLRSHSADYVAWSQSLLDDLNNIARRVGAISAS